MLGAGPYPCPPWNIPLPFAHREAGHPATRKVGSTLRIGARSCHSRRVGLKKERERAGERNWEATAPARLDRLRWVRSDAAAPGPRLHVRALLALRPKRRASPEPAVRLARVGCRAGLGWSRSAPQTLGGGARARKPCGAGWGRRGYAPRVPTRVWPPARGPTRRLCPRPGPRSLATPQPPARASPPQPPSLSPQSALRAWGPSTGDSSCGVKFNSQASSRRGLSTEVSSACAEGPQSPSGLAMNLWGPGTGRPCCSGP